MDKGKIQRNISKLPISSYNKLRLFRALTRCYAYLYCTPEEKKRRKGINNLTASGAYYGQEQWLKEYCGYKDAVFAYIEHGVYFGDNTSKVGWTPEWDLGNIITFGDSRYNLLKDLYPDYNVLRIGPRVHYAPTNKAYYEELKTKLDPTGKTMALYPLHSLHDDKHSFNTQEFLDGAFEKGKELGVKNYLLSLHPTDFDHGADLLYKDTNVVLVTGGPANEGFLPRLRSIMELADVTYSNSLGTHVGYSVYLGTPHILDLRSNPSRNKGEFSSKVREHYYEEQTTFAKVFSGDDGLTITKEQRELCDYYWGYSHIKTPEELYRGFEECKNHFFLHFKNKR